MLPSRVFGVVALSLSFLASSFLLPASASITGADVVSAIDKSKILDASIRVNAQVTPGVVYVSTYKNPKANDKDCKIEAVLLAKTVMELDATVPRVEIRFYNQNALSKYKKISVSAGDVKAFASGTMSEEQLISSLVLSEEETTDPGARLTSHLQENEYVRKKKEVSSRIDGKKIIVSTGLDPALDDVYLKLEALKLAKQGIEAVPEGIEEVEVTFYDGSSALENRLIAFKKEDILSLNASVSKALETSELKTVKAESLSVAALNIQKYVVKDGKLKSEREELLKRIRALNDAGVGYGKTVPELFVEIENNVDKLDETPLKDKLRALSDLVGKFEENLKKAKDIKPSAGGTSSSSASSAGTPAANPGAQGTPRPVGGPGIENLESLILANPDGFLAENARKLAARSPNKNGEDHPNYMITMRLVIKTLKDKGRTAEASKIEAHMNEIMQRNGRQ